MSDRSPAATRPAPLRVGTRGSALARAQTELVLDRLRAAWPARRFEPVVVSTRGDLSREVPIVALGDGAFVKAIEAELLAGRLDLAVHSLKDVPTDEDPRLSLAALPPRDDPRDALVSRHPGGLAGLPRGAVVATGSPRRGAQLLALRPDLRVVPIRGNLDTRLRRLREEGLDATVVAAAGLARLGRLDEASEVLDPELLLPAVGQGVLAVQCRAEDADARALAGAVHDAATGWAALAERSVLRGLGGGCRVPVAALAEPSGGRLRLRALIARPDGRTIERVDLAGPLEEAEALGLAAAAELRARGAAILEAASA